MTKMWNWRSILHIQSILFLFWGNCSLKQFFIMDWVASKSCSFAFLSAKYFFPLSKLSLKIIIQINRTLFYYFDIFEPNSKHQTRPNNQITCISTWYKILVLFHRLKRDKRIQQQGVCHREHSRWFPAGLFLHSAHWGVLRRPALSSAPPSLTQCQTWRGKQSGDTSLSLKACGRAVSTPHCR